METIRSTYWQNLEETQSPPPDETQSRTPYEALSAAGLDFKAVLRHTGHRSPLGKWMVDPNHMHCVREDTDEPLGVVGRRWTPVQNIDALEIVQDIASQVVVQVDSVWSTHNGRKVHMVLKWGEADTWAGEGVQPYLMWSNSHDGRSAVRLFAAAVQLGCTNQLPSLSRTAARLGLSASVVHSASAPEKMAAAARSVMEIAGWIETERDYADQLSRVTMTDRQVEQFFREVVNADKTHRKPDEAIRSMMTLWFESETAQKPKTAWRALHAVTEHYDHVAPYKTPVSRARNLAEGGPARCKRHASALLTALMR